MQLGRAWLNWPASTARRAWQHECRCSRSNCPRRLCTWQPSQSCGARTQTCNESSAEPLRLALRAPVPALWAETCKLQQEVGHVSELPSCYANSPAQPVEVVPGRATEAWSRRGLAALLVLVILLPDHTCLCLCACSVCSGAQQAASSSADAALQLASFLLFRVGRSLRCTRQCSTQHLHAAGCRHGLEGQLALLAFKRRHWQVSTLQESCI